MEWLWHHTVGGSYGEAYLSAAAIVLIACIVLPILGTMLTGRMSRHG